MHNYEIKSFSPEVEKAAKDLKNGATSVTVKTRSQAEELFLFLFQGGNGEPLKNTTGVIPNWVPNYFGGKKNTYHWDDVFDEFGKIVGHNGEHANMAHLQIHLDEIIRIFFER